MNYTNEDVSIVPDYSKKFITDDAISYEDVSIVPDYSTTYSRKLIELNTFLGRHNNGLWLKYPFISANMDTVTGVDMLSAMHDYGALGILYRSGNTTSVENCEDICQRNIDRIKLAITEWKNSGKLSFDNLIPYSISVGVKINELDLQKIDSIYRQLDKRLKTVLLQEGFTEPIGGDSLTPYLICVDVAHGHHAEVKETCILINDKLRVLYPNLMLVGGNVCTYSGAKFLIQECGCDIIKCGIGNGAACSTRIMTGCGVPQITALLDIAKLKEIEQFGLIADGGIRFPGDVAKAIVAGADAVMLGHYLAGTQEAPGNIFHDSKSNKDYKIYRGSASIDYKISNQMKSENVEGVSMLVPANGPVSVKLNELADGLRSALSYMGVTSIMEAQIEGKFVKVSNASMIEASPHGLR